MNCPNKKCGESLNCDDFWILDITNPEKIIVAVQCMNCNYYAEMIVNFNDFKVKEVKE